MIQMPRGLVPVTAAYMVGSPGGVMETEVAGGAPRYAMEYDRGVQPFNCTLILDKKQMQIWALWYLHLIKKGAVTFEMPLDSGFGVAWHRCNMVPGSYSSSRVGDDKTSVSFVVKAESQAWQYDYDQALLIVAVHDTSDDELDQLLARLSRYVNTDLKRLSLP